MASHSGRLLSRPSPKNIKNSKKLQKKWHIFCRSKMWCNNTTLATQFTATTPQKHHTNHSLFSKSPAKSHFTARKKNNKTAPQNHKQIETIYLLQSANP
jgi:hypothetical protein